MGTSAAIKVAALLTLAWGADCVQRGSAVRSRVDPIEENKDIVVRQRCDHAYATTRATHFENRKIVRNVPELAFFMNDRYGHGSLDAPYKTDPASGQEIQLKVAPCSEQGRFAQMPACWRIEDAGKALDEAPYTPGACPDEMGAVGSTCPFTLLLPGIGRFGMVEFGAGAPEYTQTVGKMEEAMGASEGTARLEYKERRWYVTKNGQEVARTARNVGCLYNTKLKMGENFEVLGDGLGLGLSGYNIRAISSSDNSVRRLTGNLFEQSTRGGFWAEAIKSAVATLFEGIAAVKCLDSNLDHDIYAVPQAFQAWRKVVAGAVNIFYLLFASSISDKEQQEEIMSTWNLFIGQLNTLASTVANSMVASQLPNHPTSDENGRKAKQGHLVELVRTKLLQISNISLPDAHARGMSQTMRSKSASIPQFSQKANTTKGPKNGAKAAEAGNEGWAPEDGHKDADREGVVGLVHTNFLQIGNISLPDVQAREMAETLRTKFGNTPQFSEKDCKILETSLGLGNDFLNLVVNGLGIAKRLAKAAGEGGGDRAAAYLVQ